MGQLGRKAVHFWVPAALLAFGQSASGAPPENLHRAPHSQEVGSSPLLGGWLPASLRSQVQALRASRRLGAASELASLLATARAAGDEATAYLGVRALAERAADSRVARQALLVHLRESGAAGQEPLRVLSRKTAALALATCGDPTTLRILVLLAGDTRESDLTRRAARNALIASPADPEFVAATTRILGVPPLPTPIAPSLPCQLPTAEAAEEPGAEVRFASLTCTPAQIEKLSNELRALTPAAPRFALRSLTILLGGGLSPEPWMTELATPHLEAPAPSVRAAAAWLLAVAAPERIPQLLKSRHPEVRDAAHNQALALGPASSVTERLDAQDDWWWFGPEEWASHSTTGIRRALARERGSDQMGLLGPWASRLNAQGGPSGPTPADWLDDYRRQAAIGRAILVAGLDRTSPANQILAQGLLERLYETEGDQNVRRLVCDGLRRGIDVASSPSAAMTGGDPARHFALRAARFEPDPICRARLLGQMLPPSGKTVLAQTTAHREVWVHRLLTPPLPLRAAPDGFVGAVSLPDPADEPQGSRLFGCEAKGSALTCDEPELTPP